MSTKSVFSAGDTVTINGQANGIMFTVTRSYVHSACRPGYDPEDEDSYTLDPVVDLAYAGYSPADSRIVISKLDRVSVDAVTAIGKK